MAIIEPVKGNCGHSLASCFCMLDEHTGPHCCVCGGSWNDNGDPVTLPHMEVFDPSHPFAFSSNVREMLDAVFGAQPQD